MPSSQRTYRKRPLARHKKGYRRMKTHNPAPLSVLDRMLRNKSELFSTLPGTWDAALPHDWLKKFSRWCEENRSEVTYDLIRSTTVWHYTGIIGVPCTCCCEVQDAYEEWQNS